MKITVAGIGPGNEQYIIPLVQQAALAADVVIGYTYYFQFIEQFISEDARKVPMSMGTEEDRAALALSEAKKGRKVLVIGSGDASIYSMASIVYELAF